VQKDDGVPSLTNQTFGIRIPQAGASPHLTLQNGNGAQRRNVGTMQVWISVQDRIQIYPYLKIHATVVQYPKNNEHNRERSRSGVSV
jgi:hypothetical protein